MDSWTVLISRDGRTDLEAARRVASLVAAAGVRVLLLPPLYDIPAGHPVADGLKRETGGFLLCSGLPPRAAEWVLRRLAGRETPGASPPVRCLCMDDFASPEEGAREVLAAAGMEAGAGEAYDFEEVPGDFPLRWYPVLDYSRCTNCGQCAEFCLFGVYESDEGLGVVAANPDLCKTGCPACARLCPNQAIMFPRCGSDALIRGEAAPDAAQQPRDAHAAALADRRKCAAGDTGDLEKLAAELDDLDI